MFIVVKLGGKVIDQALAQVINDLSSLVNEHEFVIVHGGGKQVTEQAERMGVKQKFIVSPSGFRSRYTDEETIKIYQMVVGGLINKKIVLELAKQGIKAVGLTGLDGFLLKAKRKKKVKSVVGNKVLIVEGGYTGKINHVNKEILEILLKEGYLPVIAALALGEENEPLNVDGDRAAANIASALSADALLILTDVEGIKDAKGRFIKEIRGCEIEPVLKEVGYGMKKKVLAVKEALRGGVLKAIISSGFRSNPVTKALKEENCTVVRNVGENT